MSARNPLGSTLFETTEMRTDEVILMAKIMKADGMDAEEIMLNVHAIDDMLVLQKMESIGRAMSRTPTGRLRKNYLLREQIENRMWKLIEDTKELNSNKSL
jgi:hypothetical protein